MTQQPVNKNEIRNTAGKPAVSRLEKKKAIIRRWRIMIPIVYLFFLLFFILITALSLSTGSMFLIIFGPLLAVFCLIAGPPLVIAFKRPDHLYPAEKPPFPGSQRKLCLLLLGIDFLAVVLLVVLWLVF